MSKITNFADNMNFNGNHNKKPYTQNRKYDKDQPNNFSNSSGSKNKFNTKFEDKTPLLTSFSNNVNNNNFSEKNSTNSVSKQLVEWIYKSIDVSKFKYKIIEEDSELLLLRKQKYFISANYSGTNCLLCFIKIKDKFYSFLVDRSTLSYNFSQINNFDSIAIDNVEIRLNPTIYAGTVFDGILLNDQNRKENSAHKKFIINDVYLFCGKNLFDTKIQHKIINIKAYLHSVLQVDGYDPSLNNLDLMINELLEYKDIEKLVYEYIPKIRFARGICFYPELSGTKLIYLKSKSETPTTTSPNLAKKSIMNVFDLVEPKRSDNLTNTQSINIGSPITNTNTISNPNSNSNSSSNTNTNTNSNSPKYNTNSPNPSLKKKKIKFIVNAKTKNPIVATFEIKKTNTVDVYKLYLSQKTMNNGKYIIKNKKICLAYIPTKECSSLCRTLTTQEKSRILVECHYNIEKEKWIPIKENTDKKFADSINNIEKTIQIVEISDSETELDP